VLRHEPRDSAEGHTLAGHLHPGVVVSGPGLQRERLPCFLVRPRVTVLPAFGSFTGMASVMPQPEDHAFVIAGGEVLPMS
jgi:metallophosphoesterase superfamily enzyme